MYIYIYIYNRGTGPRHNFGKPASSMGVALLLPAPFELQKLCRKSSVGKTAHEVQNGRPVDFRIRNKSGKVRSGRRAFHRCLKHMKIEGLRLSTKRCFSLKGVQISLCPPLSKRHTENHKNTFVRHPVGAPLDPRFVNNTRRHSRTHGHTGARARGVCRGKWLKPPRACAGAPEEAGPGAPGGAQHGG